MEIPLMALLAALLLVIVAYVQKQIPAFTKGGAKIALARALLMLVGIGFGLTVALYVQGTLLQLLAFLVGFGIVHVPAAIILFVKGRRGEGKS